MQLARAEAGHELPEHLAPLLAGEWAMWRCIGVRSAGFPVELVSRLANHECADAADRTLMAENELRLANREALLKVRHSLSQPEDHAMMTQSTREDLINAIRLLKTHKAPRRRTGLETVDAAIADLQSKTEKVKSVTESLRDSFRNACDRQARVIQEIAKSNRFREAVIWQNRHAFQTAVRRVAERPGSSRLGTKERQHLELAAKYLQRYCVKNDTIGFFGPMAWGRLIDDGPVMAVRLGPNFLSNREVFFEVWAIDALAEKLSEDSGIRSWIAPRPKPYLYIDANDRLVLPAAPPQILDSKTAAVFRMCDGERPAVSIARKLLSNPALGIKDEDEVYQILDALIKRGQISWSLGVPVEPRPDRALRKLLEKIEDGRLRQSALEKLTMLETARSAVTAAAEDADKLDSAIDNLEDTFVKLTGKDATRAHGATYSGRTLVYEDCRRDIEVEVGPGILASLSLPLSLILFGARWFAQATAQAFREYLTRSYRELAASQPSRQVGAVALWLMTQPMFEDPPPAIKSVERLFEEKWAKLLPFPSGERRVKFHGYELLPLVKETFKVADVRHPVNPYHCPDLMIAAPSLDAIRQGDLRFVLGELHMTCNTLGSNLFLAQHTNLEELLKAVDQDFPKQRMLAVSSKNRPKITARTTEGLLLAKDILVAVDNDAIPPTGFRCRPLSDFIVEETGGALVVRTRDGKESFDILDAFPISNFLKNRGRLLKSLKYVPRVTIDSLTICRESWRLPAGEMRFAFEKNDYNRFLGARRWAQFHAMPRLMFVKDPLEVKPFYLDFASPIYVEIFTKMIRRTFNEAGANAAISLSEMLPLPEQSWLKDGEGQTYTCELRFAVLDLSLRGH